MFIWPNLTGSLIVSCALILPIPLFSRLKAKKLFFSLQSLKILIKDKAKLLHLGNLSLQVILSIVVCCIVWICFVCAQTTKFQPLLFCSTWSIAVGAVWSEIQAWAFCSRQVSKNLSVKQNIQWTQLSQFLLPRWDKTTLRENWIAKFVPHLFHQV